MKLTTATGTISMVPGNDTDYVGVYQPLPETGISLLQVIPAVRNKVNTTDLNGPSAQAVWAQGERSGQVMLRFE